MATQTKQYKKFWVALRNRGSLILQFPVGTFTETQVKEEVSKYRQGISREKNRDVDFNRDARIEFEVVKMPNTYDLHATLVDVYVPTIKL